LKQNTLSKSERLKSKKDIEEIFSDNKSFVSSDKKILLLYKIVKQEGIKPELKFAVTVPKKIGQCCLAKSDKKVNSGGL